MNRKEIYLTIDDVPSKDFGRKVDYLIKNKIPAILFCRGGLTKKRENEVIRAIKKGFLLGNHSFSHPHFSKISLKEAEEEIKKSDELINELYKKAKVKREFKLFRFPYGDKGGKNKEKFQQTLKELGYFQPKFQNINYLFFKGKLRKELDIFWTFDFEEYRISWNKVLSKIKSRNLVVGGSLQNKNSTDIVLIHDHDETSKVFFKIIDTLIEMKIKFLKLK